MTDPPWQLDHTPEAMKRGLWEQKVIAWLLRTQPRAIAYDAFLRYCAGDREPFERASDLMRWQERLSGRPRNLQQARYGNVLENALGTLPRVPEGIPDGDSGLGTHEIGLAEAELGGTGKRRFP